ncbi:MAG: TonB family protein [Terriglobales bacterium]
MSLTQIPPTSSAASKPRQPEGGDLYDPRYWESAYREIDKTPTLVLQLQDDLSRARRREAFWLSVAVHLVVVLLLWNSDKLGRLLPRSSAMIVNPTSQNKDLTYLELPPDSQQLTKRPNTNIISDKDRIATSKTPQLDRQALKKILESSRPGTPSVPVPSQQPSGPPAAQNAGPAQPQAPAAPAINQNLEARLQTPPAPPRNPFANSGSGYVGDQIAQATRGAAANRGGYGDGGDYGLGQGGQGTNVQGGLEVLSDTMGVDFGPYLQRVLHDVKQNWYLLIPESARAPIMKKGKVGIEFAILKDGTIAGMKLVSSSGDVALDRGAWGGITNSNPFPPLPKEFGGQYLALRFGFYYNPDKGEIP